MARRRSSLPRSSRVMPSCLASGLKANNCLRVLEESFQTEKCQGCPDPNPSTRYEDEGEGEYEDELRVTLRKAVALSIDSAVIPESRPEECSVYPAVHPAW